MVRKILTLVIALGVSGVVSAAPLKSDPESSVAPPPPRTETIPRHKAGFVWAAGYWAWNERGRKYVWVPGRLLREHRGARWIPHQWTEKNGRYIFSEGHWEPRAVSAASRN